MIEDRTGLLIELAKQYVGIKEIKPNKEFKGNKYITGEAFKTLLISVGWKPGQPYCAFLNKALWHIVYPEIDLKFFSGSSRETFKRMKKCDLMELSNVPSVGAMVIYGYDGSVHGHTDLVITELNKTGFKAIGGNVGDAVKEIDRTTKKVGSRTILAFIRIKQNENI